MASSAVVPVSPNPAYEVDHKDDSQIDSSTFSGEAVATGGAGGISANALAGGTKEVKLDEMEAGGSTPDAAASAAPQAGDSYFSFKDVSWQVSVGGCCGSGAKTKTIIQDLNGDARSGEVLAILGPSGAGKTTLINVLTMENVGGRSYGTVELNGQRLTPALFQKYCVAVAQENFHWTFLTAREAVTYAAELYIREQQGGGSGKGGGGLSRAQRKTAAVDRVLRSMGLVDCADTKAGNQFIKGLSGGQKKRLALAVALIKSPTLVFLDEPTSGLDAAAAASIMKYVKNIARSERLIVVATIHQPSTEVYHGFDNVMLLSSGRTAYRGPALEVVDYFGAIGFPIAEDKNPAEFMLDQVNREFVDPAQVDRILDRWSEAEGAGKHALRGGGGEGAAPTPPPQLSARGVFRTGCCTQSGVLLRRHGTMVAKDPMLYAGRCLMYMISCTFFAIIYWYSRDRKQSQVLFRTFLLMWHVGVPTSMGVIAVFAFNTEFRAISREYKNGMVRPLAYILASTVLQIPLMFVMAVCALGVSGYAIGSWYAPNFFLMVLTFTTVLWGYENIAAFFSVQSPNPLLGMVSTRVHSKVKYLAMGRDVAQDIKAVWSSLAGCVCVCVDGLTTPCLVQLALRCRNIGDTRRPADLGPARRPLLWFCSVLTWPSNSFVAFAFVASCSCYSCSCSCSSSLFQLNYMQAWFMSFLFCGIMVAEEDVIWPFRVLCYVLPLRWGMATMGWIEFSKDSTYAGALPCGPESAVMMPCDAAGNGPPGTPAGDAAPCCTPCQPPCPPSTVNPCPAGTLTPLTACRYRRDNLAKANGTGWYCPDPTKQVDCWGISGDQVIDSLGQLYKTLEPTDHVARNLIISVAIGAGFKLLHMLLISVEIRKWGKVRRPTGSKTLKTA